MFITDMIVNVEYETNQVEAPASHANAVGRLIMLQINV